MRSSRKRRTVYLVDVVDVVDAIRAALDRSVGNGGAVRNCERDRLRQERTEAEVERLCARIPTPEEPPQHGASA